MNLNKHKWPLHGTCNHGPCTGRVTFRMLFHLFVAIRRMLRDVLQVILRRTTGRTDRGRTDDDDGRTWTDKQRTDDHDGTDDGTDGQRTTTTTDDDDDDDRTRRDTTGHDRTRRDGRRGYPIFTKKYTDGLPLETKQTCTDISGLTQQTVNQCASFYKST